MNNYTYRQLLGACFIFASSSTSGSAIAAVQKNELIFSSSNASETIKEEVMEFCLQHKILFPYYHYDKTEDICCIKNDKDITLAVCNSDSFYLFSNDPKIESSAMCFAYRIGVYRRLAHLCHESIKNSHVILYCDHIIAIINVFDDNKVFNYMGLGNDEPSRSDVLAYCWMNNLYSE